MRLWIALGLALAVTASACGGNSSSGMMGGSPTPTAPTSPTSSPTMTGTWLGTASDSTGSMMGAGMMGTPTWTITQTGNSFSGTMQLPGHMGGQMTVSGTISGNTCTYTMTMPAGSMMSGQCTATASGACDVDSMMTQFHGTYTGMNSCTGPFNQGNMSMHR